jgi:ribonuclease HII
MKHEAAGSPALTAGLDEAGRGPLAGPVAAACAALGAGFPLGCLDDSKKLTPRQRDAAAVIIRQKARAWGLGWASPAEIDRFNILQASLLAMERAFRDMCLRFSAPPEAFRCTADGPYAPDLPAGCEALVRADALVPEVMAASILAKTARDGLMLRYSRIYPGYGYEKHKGYPTKAHLEALSRLGPSPIQRLSFRH